MGDLDQLANPSFPAFFPATCKYLARLVCRFANTIHFLTVSEFSCIV